MEVLVFSAVFIAVIGATCTLALIAVIAEDRRIPVPDRDHAAPKAIAVQERIAAPIPATSVPPIPVRPAHPVPLA